MFWRLLAVGGILVALGTAGVLFTGQQDTGDASAPRLALAVTDAQELRCTKGVSSWEIHADVLARRLGKTPLSEAQLAVAYVLPGKTTAVAPVQIVTRDGFASGVSSQADTVRFSRSSELNSPVKRTPRSSSRRCGWEANRSTPATNSSLAASPWHHPSSSAS